MFLPGYGPIAIADFKNYTCKCILEKLGIAGNLKHTWHKVEL
jgi:hypothetical protein